MSAGIKRRIHSFDLSFFIHVIAAHDFSRLGPSGRFQKKDSDPEFLVFRRDRVDFPSRKVASLILSCLVAAMDLGMGLDKRPSRHIRVAPPRAPLTGRAGAGFTFENGASSA